MKKEYQIVTGNTPGALKAKVDVMLSEGWSLQGGVSALIWPLGSIPDSPVKGFGTEYSQALYRER